MAESSHDPRGTGDQTHPLRSPGVNPIALAPGQRVPTVARQAAMFNQPDLHQLRAPDPDRAQTVQAWIADPTGQAPATPADQASARITPTPSIGVSDLIGAAITSTPSVSLNALASFGRQLRAGLGHLAQPVQSRDGREHRPTERTVASVHVMICALLTRSVSS